MTVDRSVEGVDSRWATWNSGTRLLNASVFRTPESYRLPFTFCFSVAESCPTLCSPTDCSTPSFPALHYLVEFAQTHDHWVGNAIQASHPLLPPSPPALNLSQHQDLFLRSRFFASGGQRNRASASASVLPMNIQGWFPLGWFDLFAVQGTLKSLLQHHNSKASLLRRSAFFMVQLSHSYMTTGKTIALTRWTFVGKAMSLLF